MSAVATDDDQAARAAETVRDVPALVRELVRGVRSLCRPDSRLVGIATGGVWLAGRLQAELGLAGEHGVLSSTLHRDDFAQRGLSAREPTRLGFDVNGAHIVVVDDVLYTGRTIRAVLNELYDFGRPASVRLAVLIERDGRELPIQADFAAARVELPANRSVALRRDAAGAFSVVIEART